MVGVARLRRTTPDARVNISRARRVAPAGFTLLELMITLSVLAILASLGVPAMQEMLERNRLKGAAQALAEDLQWVRGEAIAAKSGSASDLRCRFSVVLRNQRGEYMQLSSYRSG